MSFKQTKFLCVDNTGVRLVRCIEVYGSNIVKPGAIILVSIKKVVAHRKIRKGQLYKCVVVRLNRIIKRCSGFLVRYFVNSIILLKKTDLVPLGTRIYGSVFFEVRLKGFMKIVLLSSFLI